MRGWFKTVSQWLTGTLPPPEFATADPPDWVIVVRLVMLPPAQKLTFRIRLWPLRGDFGGTISNRPFVHQPLAGAGSLDFKSLNEFRRLAELAVNEPVLQQQSIVDDGAPGVVRLFRREPYVLSQQPWNFGVGWSDPLATPPPVVQLANTVFSLYTPK